MRKHRAIATLATAVAALALAGCGGGESTPEAAPTAGERVFDEAGCGDCHALDAAGSSGRTGPDLDEVRPSAAEVEQQVREGGGGMPSFEDDLSDEQIRDVAEFVSSSASR